jgi:hypothetical protein
LWKGALRGGALVAGGTAVVRLDGQGCIAEVVGFLDGGAAWTPFGAATRVPLMQGARALHPRLPSL